jgi:sigma-B regulation protein RsbU (phosphoserine phosphatase)
MSFASGGHPPAILMDTSDRQDSKIQKLRTPNFIIGSEFDAIYISEKQIISEKNKLYVFSDGVYEIETANGSMWRFKEFTDFIKGLEAEKSSSMDMLIEHAKNLSNSQEFEDDVTIVEISFN